MGGCVGTLNIKSQMSHLEQGKACIQHAKETLSANEIENAIEAYEQAIDYLKGALKDNVQLTKPLLIQSYLDLGNLYEQQKAFEKAKFCYNEAKNLGEPKAVSKFEELTTKMAEMDLKSYQIKDLSTSVVLVKKTHFKESSEHLSPLVDNREISSSSNSVKPLLLEHVQDLTESDLQQKLRKTSRSFSFSRKKSSVLGEETPRIESSRGEKAIASSSTLVDKTPIREYIELSNGRTKALWPENYSCSPGGKEQPWAFEQSLHYSKEWQDKGSYRLLLLDNNQPDFKFVEALYSLHIEAGYEVDEIMLLSDEGDEQAFIAELDLLEKKHDNWVHQAKWKPKNKYFKLFRLPQLEAKQYLSKEEQEELVKLKNPPTIAELHHEVDEQQKLPKFLNQKQTREQLKSLRYRSPHAPHVKLLPLWHAVNVEKIKQLRGAGFNDLNYVNDGILGKGYYGKSNSIAAYLEGCSKYGDRTLLVLSWYAGKVVYPVHPDEHDLKGQPHYANHDLHYKIQSESCSEAVVFDPGQILPRYLVSVKKSGISSGIMAELLNIPRLDPGMRSLLFQMNFSQIIGQIAKGSFEQSKDWLEYQDPDNLIVNETLPEEFKDKHQKLVVDFLQDLQKEVLLLKTADETDSEIFSRFIEAILWNEYQEGQAIPLHVRLSEILQKAQIIEQSLSKYNIAEAAVFDLKKYKRFNFIISNYEKKSMGSLLKANYINYPGGFRGKVIVICSKAQLVDEENYWLYTEGGTLEQQRSRLNSYNLDKFTQKQIKEQIFFIKEISINTNKKILSPKEKYNSTAVSLSFNQNTLLPSPGGELKPWEYCNELYYSSDWINKGAFKLHKLKKSNPDYDFVTRSYQQTAVPEYEIDEIYVISDRGAEQAFIANLNILERRSTKPEYKGDWQEEGHVELRQKVIDKLEEKSYKSLLVEHIKLVPLWHGTGPAAASGIAKSGFASLALVDCGYFGKGLYGSSSAEYSYRVYGKGFRHLRDEYEKKYPKKENPYRDKNPGNGDEGLLILSWYSAQNVFPVVKWDTCPGVDKSQDKLMGKANYKNYDTHFVRVRPKDLMEHELGKEDAYFPIGDGEIDTYQEFVTFPTAQVLPRYIVSLKKLGEKSLPGMQKFLDMPFSISITGGLYQHSLDRTIVELNESARREIDEDFMVNQGLELYIPSMGTNSDEIDNVKEEDQYLLLKKAEEFIAGTKEKELWLLQGNAGSGKSLFGRYLEKWLWEEDRYKQYDLIPLFVPLPRIGVSTDNLINKVLELKGISPENIEELRQKKKFLFILDGYDEIPGKPRLLQKYAFNEEQGWQGKVIVGSRSQYLGSEEERFLYPRHKGDDLNKSRAHCIKSYIIPFKQEEVKEYINGFCASKFNKGVDKANWEASQYEETLEQFQKIKEFLKEPFLLFLILSVLPELSKQGSRSVKKIDLYDAFTMGWFKSQFERMIKHDNIELVEYTEENLLEMFNEYAKELAYEMFLQNTQVLKNPRNLNEKEQGSFNRFFAGNQASIAFQGSPLKKIGESYLFIHKSFQEYFVARRILDEIENEEELPALTEKLISDPAIISFIVNKPKIIREEKIKEKLFRVIERSSDNSGELEQLNPLNSSISAANAITILNAAKVVFSGRNLRGIQISGADLRGAILDSTNLEGADLTNVQLTGAWLHNANLTRSRLLNSKFGELPYFRLLHDEPKVNRPYFFSGEYFATTLGENSIVIYKINFKTNTTNYYKTVFVPIQFVIKGIAFNCYLDRLLLVLYSETLLLVYSINEGDSKLTIPNSSIEIPEICSIALSSNNEWLALGGKDGTIHLKKISYDGRSITITEDQMLLQDSSGGIIYKIKFNSNGNLLVSGVKIDEGKVKVCFWDLKNQRQIQELLEGDYVGFPLDLALSPDNKWLALSYKKGKIILYDRNNNVRKELDGHTNEVHSINFNSNSDGLASGGYDKTVRLWSLTELGSCKILKGHTDYVCGVAFTRDDSVLLSGSDDQTVRFWDDTVLHKDNTIHNSQLLTNDHSDYVYSVNFSPDGKMLASGSRDKTIILRNFANDVKRVLTDHDDFVFSVAFSHNNHWLVSGSKDGTVRRWITETFPRQDQVLYKNTESAPKPIRSVAFSADDSWLAWGCDNRVYLYNYNQEVMHDIFLNHTEHDLCLMSDLQKEGIPINIENNKIYLESSSPEGWVDYVVLDQVGEIVKGSLYLSSLSGNKLDKNYLQNNKNKLLLEILEITFKRGHTYHTSEVYSVAFSQAPLQLAAGINNGTILVWNLSTSRKAEPVILNGHGTCVDSVVFSPDSQWLVSGSWDKKICLWQQTITELKQILFDHTAEVNVVTFSKDGRYLFSGDYGGTLIVWKLQQEQMVKECSVRVGSNVFSISTSLDDDDQPLIATGCADHSVRIWQYIGKQLILLETTHQTVLCVDQLDITGTILSSNNKELLRQRGAIGEPVINDTIIADEISERVAELRLVEQSSKPLLFSQGISNPVNPVTTKAQEDDNLTELSHKMQKLLV